MAREAGLAGDEWLATKADWGRWWLYWWRQLVNAAQRLSSEV
jgi:hypothetical protein